MKKRVKRFVAPAAILVVAAFLLVPAGGPLARWYAARIAERDFPPPGRSVLVDGRRAHIQCSGEGSPTIILESGLDNRGSWSWSGIQEELSGISRVCAYDRAGIMWSEPGENPRDAEQMASELHAILSAASEAPPYVMVGHSMGGLLIRVYDQRYPDESAGFVFVDSSHPEQIDRFPAEFRARRANARSFSLRRWALTILAPYRMIFEHDTPSAAYRWRSDPGVRREAAAFDSILEQAGRTGSLGNRPVVVLTRGAPAVVPDISEEGAAAMRQTWQELHEELAALSTNSDHRIVEGAGHYIHVDQPAAVVAGIRDVVTAAREGRSVEHQDRVPVP